MLGVTDGLKITKLSRHVMNQEWQSRKSAGGNYVPDPVRYCVKFVRLFGIVAVSLKKFSIRTQRLMPADPDKNRKVCDKFYSYFTNKHDTI